MKSAGEIFEMAKAGTEPHDVFELGLYTALKNIIHLYQTRQIDTDEAGRLKNRAYSDYNSKVDSYARAKQKYACMVRNIAKSEELRVRLNKECTLDTALELIGVYSGQEEYYNKMRRKNK